MSIYDISKVSRNKYISDNIKACEQEIELSHELFLNIKNCIMSQTDESTVKKWEEWFNLPDEKNWNIKDRVDRVMYTFNSSIHLSLVIDPFFTITSANVRLVVKA